MHIPEHYLSPTTCAVFGAAMLPVWVASVKKVKRDFTKENLPLLGVGAAISFLIMMINVPLPGGTTGHAVGGVLIGILLGPYAACISISTALFIQALLFGDGGLLAFGANSFNMAFIMPFVGYHIYSFLEKKCRSQVGKYAAIAFSSYVGLNLAAFCTAVQFGIQPLLFTNTLGQPMYCPYSLSVSIPAMTIPHLAVAGLVEAAITVSVIAYVKKFYPSFFDQQMTQKLRPVHALLTGLICLSPIGMLASGTAWGEWGIDEISSIISNGSVLGYIPEGMKQGFVLSPIMPDYMIPGIPDFLAYTMTALTGTLLSIAIFQIVKRSSVTFVKTNLHNKLTKF